MIGHNLVNYTFPIHRPATAVFGREATYLKTRRADPAWDLTSRSFYRRESSLIGKETTPSRTQETGGSISAVSSDPQIVGYFS